MEMYGTLEVIGKGFPNNNPARTIVGIAGDARLRRNEGLDAADVYAPLNPGTFNRVLLARARNDARQLLPLMKGAARSINERAIPDARLLADDFARRTGEPRAMSALLSALAVLAVSLTCLGVFGIVSYAATLRRKELGIRLALGANRRSVVLTLVREVRWPLLAGIAFGLLVALPFGALFAGAPLYVRPFDIPVLAGVAIFLIVVTGIAAVLPAWRALRSDVLQSLKCE